MTNQIKFDEFRAKSNSHTSESYKNCIQTDGSDDKKKNKIDLDTVSLSDLGCSNSFTSYFF